MRSYSVFLGLGLWLCGTPLMARASSTNDPTAADSDASYKEAFEKAFRTAYRVKSVNACIAAAPETAAFDLTPTCVCMTETFLATKSVEQLEILSKAQEESEEIKAVAAQCLKTDPPWRRASSGNSEKR